MIDENQARQIAVEHVSKQESGVQPEIKSVERKEIWAMEVSWPAQMENVKGRQYAKLNVYGSGEVKDYQKTDFRSDSRIKGFLSKLKSMISRGKPPAASPT